MRLDSNPRTPKLLTESIARAKQGIPSSLGKEIAAIMRRGPGSVQEQFTRQALDSAIRGSQSWPPSKDFGTRPAPSTSLKRTGKLLSAWLGGAGSITRTGSNYVEIGASVPHAAAHQDGALVRASTRTGGRLSMQIYLGVNFGVWISEKKLLSGLKIPPRPVGISRRMMDRAGNRYFRFVTEGR